MFEFLLITIFFNAVTFGNALPKMGNFVETAASTPERFAKIMNGYEISIEQAPYQVQIMIKDHKKPTEVSRCCGAIIAKNWVLTAAHCCDSDYAKDYTVVAGTNNSSRSGSIHKVLQLIRHNNSHDDHMDNAVNDIAVIQVKTPFKLDATRKAVKLFTKNSESLVGKLAQASGWGDHGTPDDRTVNPDILNMIDVKIISNDECDRLWGKHTAGNGRICAAPPQGRKDVCEGDSGGPLVFNKKLVGIVSFGNDCNVTWTSPTYGVYTDVAIYHDWISKNTKLTL